MSLLAQHSDVVAIQQCGILHKLMPIIGWWSSTGGHGKRIVSRSTFSEPAEGEARSGDSYIGDYLRPAELHERCGSMIEHVFDAVRSSANDAPVLVDQTPENLELSDTLLQLVPDAWFLHIVRDPRSVFCSMRSANSSWAGGEFPTTPESVGQVWQKYMDHAEHLKNATDRFFEVKYEDILADGPNQLTAIFDWLGIPADAAFSEQAIEDCRIQRLRKKNIAPTNFFRKGQSKGWVDEASKADVASVEFYAAQTMQKYGYDLVNSQPMSRPLQEKLRSLKSRMIDQVKKLARRIGLAG